MHTRMLRNAQTPNRYFGLIRRLIATFNSEKVNMAMCLFREMKRRNVPLSSDLYSNLINASHRVRFWVLCVWANHSTTTTINTLHRYSVKSINQRPWWTSSSQILKFNPDSERTIPSSSAIPTPLNGETWGDSQDEILRCGTVYDPWKKNPFLSNKHSNTGTKDTIFVLLVWTRRSIWVMCLHLISFEKCNVDWDVNRYQTQEPFS